jgi:hypothetical protein
MKTCRTCGVEQPLDAFYIHRETADGHLNHCKACVKARMRRYGQTPAGKATNARKQARDKVDGKDRSRAYILNRVHRGTLVRPPCEVCGKPNAHAHHADYGQPLVVRWLCSKHHGEVHRMK